MKKILSALVIASLVLAGCSSSDDGPAELRVSTWAGGTELEEFQAIVDDLNEEHVDEYNITIESIPAEYEVKVQTQASAGQAADLIWISQENIASYADEGVLVNLDDYLADSDLNQYTFNENLLAATKLDDSQYAVPWIANPLILYYNKDIVSDKDQEKLEATNKGEFLTWDDFTKMAEAYTDLDNDKNGVLINGWPPVEFFMWTYGGALEDENGNLTVDTPEAKEGIDQLNDLVVKSKVTPNFNDINTVGYTETFQEGNTAFLFGGVADGIEKIGGTEDIPFDLGYAVVPGSKDINTTFNYSASLGVTTDSDNPDVAFAALEDMTAKIFEWKVVPPIDITELGYDNYEDYISTANPVKAGMGATIDQSMAISHQTIYTPASATNAGIGYEKIYQPILDAGVTGNEVDTQQLIDAATESADGE